MDERMREIAIEPGTRSGSVCIPSGKSQLQRLLICAALSCEPSELLYSGRPCADVAAVAGCLNALGAKITDEGGAFRVEPLDRERPAKGAVLHCGQSGAALRFMLPLAGALGAECSFVTEGRLSDRPLAPLAARLCEHGMDIRRSGRVLSCSGRLRGGDFVLPGDVSSQYVSGLLMAFGALDEPSRIVVEGAVESEGYIRLTEQVLSRCGADAVREGGVWTCRPSVYRFSAPARAEGDWSSAGPFLCMGALSERGTEVSGLDPHSLHPDRAILGVLKAIGAEVELDAAQERVKVRRGLLKAFDLDASGMPDSVPALAALACACEGLSEICGARRLRFKESDRIASSAAMLRALGAEVEEMPEGLAVRGRAEGKTALNGGRVRTAGDHRIAMAAAVAACACAGPVIAGDADCVEKSYPDFWEDLAKLEVSPHIEGGTGA